MKNRLVIASLICLITVTAVIAKIYTDGFTITGEGTLDKPLRIPSAAVGKTNLAYKSIATNSDLSSQRGLYVGTITDDVQDADLLRGNILVNRSGNMIIDSVDTVYTGDVAYFVRPFMSDYNQLATQDSVPYSNLEITWGTRRSKLVYDNGHIATGKIYNLMGKGRTCRAVVSSVVPATDGQTQNDSIYFLLSSWAGDFAAFTFRSGNPEKDQQLLDGMQSGALKYFSVSSGSVSAGVSGSMIIGNDFTGDNVHKSYIMGDNDDSYAIKFNMIHNFLPCKKIYFLEDGIVDMVYNRDGYFKRDLGYPDLIIKDNFYSLGILLNDDVYNPSSGWTSPKVHEIWRSYDCNNDPSDDVNAIYVYNGNVHFGYLSYDNRSGAYTPVHDQRIRMVFQPSTPPAVLNIHETKYTTWNLNLDLTDTSTVKPNWPAAPCWKRTDTINGYIPTNRKFIFNVSDSEGPQFPDTLSDNIILVADSGALVTPHPINMPEYPDEDLFLPGDSTITSYVSKSAVSTGMYVHKNNKQDGSSTNDSLVGSALIFHDGDMIRLLALTKDSRTDTDFVNEEIKEGIHVKQLKKWGNAFNNPTNGNGPTISYGGAVPYNLTQSNNVWKVDAEAGKIEHGWTVPKIKEAVTHNNNSINIGDIFMIGNDAAVEVMDMRTVFIEEVSRWVRGISNTNEKLLVGRLVGGTFGDATGDVSPGFQFGNSYNINIVDNYGVAIPDYSLPMLVTNATGSIAQWDPVNWVFRTVIGTGDRMSRTNIHIFTTGEVDQHGDSILTSDKAFFKKAGIAVDFSDCIGGQWHWAEDNTLTCTDTCSYWQSDVVIDGENYSMVVPMCNYVRDTISFTYKMRLHDIGFVKQIANRSKIDGKVTFRYSPEFSWTAVNRDKYIAREEEIKRRLAIPIKENKSLIKRVKKFLKPKKYVHKW